MNRFSYVKIQLTAWTVVLAFYAFAISFRPILVHIEFFYAFILVVSAGVVSNIIRRVYKDKLSTLPVLKQALYLVCLSLLVAALATSMLVIAVFIVSNTPLAFPIPSDQRLFVVRQVFAQNWINVSGLMLLWSSLYFAITRARMLTATKAALKQTELEVLQNQLNPHFLFNALNNIRALVLEDAHKSRDMITSLSDILRYSLTKQGTVKVALKDELTFILNYIDLCKIQFEERLQFDYDIDEGLEDILVPKMVIQLCIENAIKHGIEPNIKGGQITLYAEKQNGKLDIKVENSVSPEADPTDSLGIGLANLRDRFTLLYDKTASFNTTKTAETFTVEMRFPIETQ